MMVVKQSRKINKKSIVRGKKAQTQKRLNKQVGGLFGRKKKQEQSAAPMSPEYMNKINLIDLMINKINYIGQNKADLKNLLIQKILDNDTLEILLNQLITDYNKNIINPESVRSSGSYGYESVSELPKSNLNHGFKAMQGL